MPRCLHASNTSKISLESDASIPQPERPYFVCRPLNGIQWREAAKLCEQFTAGGATSGTSAIDGLYEALLLAVIGWCNMVDRTGPEPILIPFHPQNLPLVICPVEGAELLTKILNEAQLSPDDKKKSDSPPSSAAV